jgi:BirA family biotin operon repressor/biotin-[acetyl-CoA-carboxylase] ligase
MNTLFVGQHLVELNSVDSTNNYSTELLRAGLAYEGTAVWSHEQTQGRGQRGNPWLSETGKNLTTSIILFPTFITADRQFEITMCAALSVLDTVEHFTGLKGNVKWPNDVYLENKKCAGILIENTLSGKNISTSIIGIGLNVNQQEFHGLNACSISQYTSELEIKSVLKVLCENVEKNYLMLRQNPVSLKNNYLEKLFRKNVMGPYKFDGEVILAKITGVAETGKLKLFTEDGEEIEAGFKEIEFLN